MTDDQIRQVLIERKKKDQEYAAKSLGIIWALWLGVVIAIYTLF